MRVRPGRELTVLVSQWDTFIPCLRLHRKVHDASPHSGLGWPLEVCQRTRANGNQMAAIGRTCLLWIRRRRPVRVSSDPQNHTSATRQISAERYRRVDRTLNL